VVRPIDLWYLGSNIEEKFWQFTAATAGFGAARYAFTGNPAQLRQAYHLASFGVRAHAAAVRGVLGTRLVAGGAHTLGSAAATGLSAIAVGYTSGAVIGTGISQAIFGEEGAKQALDLYTSPGNFWDKGIMGMGDNISTIAEHYLR